jgi:hypothetical protein
MRKAESVCLALPAEVIDRLRADAATLGMSVSGYAKIVLVAGLQKPLPKALLETATEGGASDGPEV